MRSMRVPVWCALGLCVLLLAFQGLRSSARDKAGDKVKAEDVLKEWVFPKADVQGPYWPRSDKDFKHADLASQSLAPEQPMEKVWKYYADKCGYKNKFPGPGAAVRDGTGDEKARYLMNFLGGGAEHNKTYRCTFTYNTDRYTVFVELASGWEDRSTAVQVTVGTR